jgi:sialidase-1
MKLLATFLLAATALVAAEPDASKLHAWYRTEGLKSNGASVTAWENSAAPSRSLTRTVGEPSALRVATPGGERTVLRLDGKSALWQPANAWGSLADARTVVAFLRLAPKAEGVLFDGTTNSGMTRAQVRDGTWQAGVQPPPIANADSADAATHAAATGEWQVHAFTFKKSASGTDIIHRIGAGGAKTAATGKTAPLSGFILGANVATKRGLACDVAELLVYDRALDHAELAKTTAYLAEKWGAPADLPAERQPKPATLSDDPRIFHTTVRKQGDDGVHTYRIPGLATTPRGTLIAVFDARNKGNGDLPGDIDVGMVRSTDDGATWSAMQRIMDFDATVPGSRGNGVGDPAVLVDAKTGAIFVTALWSKGNQAWNGSGPGMTPDETGQFVIVKSTDDGATWSKPVNITPQVKNPAWRLCFNGPGNGIALRDGTLVFPAQFKGADNVPHSCFIASTDHGATWKISPPAIPAKPPTSESAIAELADGSLLLSMRDESRSGQRAWARWDWNGRVSDGKWSEPWLGVTDPTCMGSLIRHPHGELLLSNPNNSTKRVALTIRSSNDGGKTWNNGKLLDPRTSMYSCMSVLRDGRIGILYESGDTAGLIFARFPLEWLSSDVNESIIPESRLERTGKFGWWPGRHEQKLEEVKQGADIVFLGDSITQNWETAGKDVWREHFSAKHALNLGFGGDSTQHVLWRLDHGEFDGLNPKAVVLLIGTNNARHSEATPPQIAEGIRAIIERIHAKAPSAKVLLHAIFPRGTDANDPWRKRCIEINQLLPTLANGERVHFIDLGSKFTNADGTISKAIMPDLLHLSAQGYEIWADEIKTKLEQLLARP